MEDGEGGKRRTTEAVLAPVPSFIALSYSYPILAHSDAITHSVFSVTVTIREGGKTTCMYTHIMPTHHLNCTGDGSVTENKQA